MFFFLHFFAYVWLPSGLSCYLFFTGHVFFSYIFCCCPVSQINTGDVEEVDALFHDAKASAQLLTEDADGYLH